MFFYFHRNVLHFNSAFFFNGTLLSLVRCLWNIEKKQGYPSDLQSKTFKPNLVNMQVKQDFSKHPGF